MDSRRPIFAELSLVPEGANPVVFDTRGVLKSITVEVLSSSAVKGNVSLFDPAFTRIESILVATSGSRKIRLRFGWEEDAPPAGNVPTFYGTITEYQPGFAVEGLSLSLDFIGTAMLLQALDKKPEKRAWPEGTVVSQIVRDLATSFGWATEDVFDGRTTPTVETTDGVTDTALGINDESAFKFIQDTLIKRAVNSRGEGYYAHLDDTRTPAVIHFHSENFLTSAGPVGQSAAHRFVFARGQPSRVQSFEVAETGIFQALLGAKGGEYESNDSVDGTRVRGEGAKPGDEAKKGLAKDHRLLPDEVSLPAPLATGTVKSRRPIIARDDAEMVRQAQAIISRTIEHAVKATLKVIGTHDVRVFDLVEVVYQTPSVSESVQAHYLSGVYTCHGVSHDFGSGGWTTTLKMLRRGGLATGGPGRDARVDGKRVAVSLPASDGGAGGSVGVLKGVG